MSDQFPLESDAFTGAGRLTAQQRSEGRAQDKAPLFELLNTAALTSEDETVMSGAIDLSAATAAVIAAANRGLTTNIGAARTFTLPDFAAAPEGWEHTLISFDAAAFELTIAAAGSDTINAIAGDITLTTANHEWVKVFKVPGATGWHAIGGTAVTPA